jgi:hypothetical protein
MVNYNRIGVLRGSGVTLRLEIRLTEAWVENKCRLVSRRGFYREFRSDSPGESREPIGRNPSLGCPRERVRTEPTRVRLSDSHSIPKLRREPISCAVSYWHLDCGLGMT